MIVPASPFIHPNSPTTVRNGKETMNSVIHITYNKNFLPFLSPRRIAKTFLATAAIVAPTATSTFLLHRFCFYLPPALPNSFALYSGAMTCKR